MIALVVSFICLLILMLFLLIFFKSNAGVLFFAACASLLLLDSLDPTVVAAAGAVVPLREAEAYIRSAVIVLSLTFAAMAFRHSISSHQMPVHVLLAAVTALLLWLFLPEVLGLSPLATIMQETIWQNVNGFRTLVIASGFAVAIVSLLLLKSSHKHAGKKHGH